MIKTEFGKLLSETLPLQPGIVKLIDANSKKNNPVILSDGENEKAIQIELGHSGLLISIHIFLSIDVNAKVVCQDVQKTIQSLAKKHNQNIENIEIYIRGVN